jgi:hypothetical protein
VQRLCEDDIYAATPVNEGLSDGEIWIAHGGVNPSGLVVRQGGV